MAAVSLDEPGGVTAEVQADVEDDAEPAGLDAETRREGPAICQFCVLRSKPGCIHGACKLCCRKQSDPASSPDRPSCPVHRPKGAGAGDAGALAARSGVQELDPTLYRASAIEAAEVLGEGSTSLTASSRVLLIGIGADELLGGYARHRTARARRGADGVRAEMLKDLERLWTRNLGRDDRIVADHGREARHPFLDEDVLEFVGRLPMGLLAFGPEGEARPAPDKWLLRQVAADRGLHHCARFRKRAIQFGSRIAKQSNVWHTGSNRKVRGDMAYNALASSREGGAAAR